jgi:hypothetical protein
MHLTADPATAERDLRALGRHDLGDHLRFEVVRSVALSVDNALKLKIEAYTGTTKWESFDIDGVPTLPSTQRPQSGDDADRHGVARSRLVRRLPRRGPSQRAARQPE